MPVKPGDMRHYVAESVDGERVVWTRLSADGALYPRFLLNELPSGSDYHQFLASPLGTLAGLARLEASTAIGGRSGPA